MVRRITHFKPLHETPLIGCQKRVGLESVLKVTVVMIGLWGWRRGWCTSLTGINVSSSPCVRTLILCKHAIRRSNLVENYAGDEKRKHDVDTSMPYIYTQYNGLANKQQCITIHHTRISEKKWSWKNTSSFTVVYQNRCTIVSGLEVLD